MRRCCRDVDGVGRRTSPMGVVVESSQSVSVVNVIPLDLPETEATSAMGPKEFLESRQTYSSQAEFAALLASLELQQSQ